MQERWCQDCRGAAKLVIIGGEKAVTMIKEMERVGTVTGATFRAVEPVVVPEEDIMKVIGLMDPVNGKPTASRLRAVAAEVSEARWWRWCLLHPELPEDLIHKSRSVFCS